MLQEWKGANKDKLIQELDLTSSMSRNLYIEWYFTNIHSELMKFTSKEVASTDIHKMPITKFLFNFIKELHNKGNICTETEIF